MNYHISLLYYLSTRITLNIARLVYRLGIVTTILWSLNKTNHVIFYSLYRCIRARRYGRPEIGVVNSFVVSRLAGGSLYRGSSVVVQR